MLGPMLHRPRSARPSPHHAYDAVADASAALVIGAYSTSFGLASRLLAEPVRSQVRNVYALVRVADEIVDAPRPDQGPEQQRQDLDTLQEETRQAIATGSSSNLVVHAFARTARRCGIDDTLVAPFFDSMRTDLDRTVHDRASLDAYVYGSAEVVGLMCLRTFVAAEHRPAERYDELAVGAQRLGAAFQKVNFLRDLGEDADQLGRRYLPGLDPSAFDDATRDQWLDEIDADLRSAATVVERLPRGSRLAVCAAHDLFAELSARLRRTPAHELAGRRVRVPDAVKARLVAAAFLRGGRPRVAVAG